jgi:hypothetical protein
VRPNKLGRRICPLIQVKLPSRSSSPFVRYAKLQTYSSTTLCYDRYSSLCYQVFPCASRARLACTNLVRAMLQLHVRTHTLSHQSDVPPLFLFLEPSFPTLPGAPRALP